MGVFNIKETVKNLEIKSNISINPSSGSTTSGTHDYGITAGAETNPQIFIFNAIVIFLVLISVGTVIVLVLAGVKYITAGGDAEKAESGKKTMLGAIIGMIIILASFVAFNFAVSVLNTPARLSDPAEVQELMDKTY